MKNNILADTSVWIEFFKMSSDSGYGLEKLLKESRVALCGVVLFELLQGVRSESEKRMISEILSGLPYTEMSPHLWEKAAELCVSLKKNGLNLPLSDIFIAAIAIEHDFCIFTLDRHFEQIPGVKLFSES